ncbi:MAG: hypothetical protein K2O95_04670 [Clostridia bacterium]|nr:hypothetical protein [Clostridia bacterium]
MTRNLKTFTALGVILTTVFGALFHFVYEWSGNNFIAGLLFATNESVWEHIKLALFPMMIIFLFGSIYLKGANNFAQAAFCAMLTVIILIPLAFFAYTSAIGKSVLPMDISIFIFSIILAYLVAYRIFGTPKRPLLNIISLVGIAVIVVCFFTFTYFPPDFILFKEIYLQ